ncbi:MAG TPA: hypothetical protein VFZ28_05365, partial [Burkholderiaceae bacterium]|nr:hypothetical protein [Burkholderiaceae bacterium]
MSPDDRRMAFALSVSLGVHALVFHLTFGGQGVGLPRMAFPWQERRIEVPDLRIVLVAPPAAPATPATPTMP